MSERLEFHYSKAIAPMIWVLFGLSIVELVAVHLIVTLQWPLIGWPLTILSALGAVWMLFWIRSFRTRPHLLDGNHLRLNLGHLKSVEIDLENIARIKRTLEQGALDQKDIINLAGIAYPNRAIEVKEPLKSGRNRVFIRLDEPEAFDLALQAFDVSFDA